MIASNPLDQGQLEAGDRRGALGQGQAQLEAGDPSLQPLVRAQLAAFDSLHALGQGQLEAGDRRGALGQGGHEQLDGIRLGLQVRKVDFRENFIF